MSRTSSTFAKSLRNSDRYVGGKWITPTAANVKRVPQLSASADSRSLNKSQQLTSIEGEYIKNLQQQIYFLELEASYLREQTKKATELHPQMVEEATQMISRLKTKEADVDSLKMELLKKDGLLEASNMEKQQLADRMEELQRDLDNQRAVHRDEILELTKNKELLHNETLRKSSSIDQKQLECDRLKMALEQSERQVELLKKQMEDVRDQHRLTQTALEDSRAELIRRDVQLRDNRDRERREVLSEQEKTAAVLRQEIQLLRSRLREADLNVSTSRMWSEDSAVFHRENAALKAELEQLRHSLDQERTLRQTENFRLNEKSDDLAKSHDREGTLKLKLESVEMWLKNEQQRNRTLQDRIDVLESEVNGKEAENQSVRSKLMDVEVENRQLRQEVTSLRVDKNDLCDHIEQQQKSLDENHSNFERIQQKNRLLERQLKSVETEKSLTESWQQQRWDELGKLADSMRLLSAGPKGLQLDPTP